MAMANTPLEEDGVTIIKKRNNVSWFIQKKNQELVLMVSLLLMFIAFYPLTDGEFG